MTAMTRHTKPSPRKPRILHGRAGGFTLVEVVIALTIFGVIMVSMGAFGIKFVRAVWGAGLQSTASDLAIQRIETVKSGSLYGNLETQFVGTESSIAGYPGFTRVTHITHIGGNPTDSVDYKVVSVTVSTQRLATPVKKTTIIANF
jgi:prepilin-type N-terminal cleavage/methylation domain-containing protein